MRYIQAENWSLAEKKKILSRPARKFPAPGPPPLDDSASTNGPNVEMVEEQRRPFFERIGLQTRPKHPDNIKPVGRAFIPLRQQ
jgi:hypothetical protein